MEKTYVMVKPHFANNEDVISEIKKRILDLGLNITEEKFVNYDEESASAHYHAHVGRPYFPELLAYITSDKAYGMIVEGENAKSKVRALAGATIKMDSEGNIVKGPKEGDIRYDIPKMLNEEMKQTENVVHTSDDENEEDANIEIEVFSKL